MQIFARAFYRMFYAHQNRMKNAFLREFYYILYITQKK